MERKKLVNMIMEDIEFNIYDMYNDEYEIVMLLYDYIKHFTSLEFVFPKRKKELETLIKGVNTTLNRCFEYLLIPNNQALAVTVRTLIETYIFAKFFIDNKPCYILRWMKWPTLRLSKVITNKDCIDIANQLKKEIKNDYDKELNNKLDFESILDNPYGWVYPEISKNINLQHIALHSGSDEEYKDFQDLSFHVHNNTILQLFRSRFLEDTYNFLSYITLYLDRFVDLFEPYLKDKRLHKKEIYFQSLQILGILDKYFDNKKLRIKEINKII